MRFSNTVAALCLAFSTQLLATPVDITPRQNNCVHPAGGVHIVIAGGKGPTDNPGLLQSLIDQINGAFPGSNQFVTPYDGSDAPAGFATGQMTSHINSYHSQCPSTSIVILGYSLGGIVAMNTACGGIAPPAGVKAIIAYGEETRTAGASYNRGTCTGMGEYPRADPASCNGFAAKIQSYCDTPDPECCRGGGDGQTHFSYPKYDAQALGFIQSQIPNP